MERYLSVAICFLFVYFPGKEQSRIEYFHAFNILKVTFTTNLFFGLRENVLFSRYLDFCVFVKFKEFKMSNVIIGIAA